MDLLRFGRGYRLRYSGLFLEDIGLGDTSYILQWSSSMGVEDYKGLRCHIFMLLDAPMNPATLKNWLYSLNLTTRILQIQLELTKTNMALRWPQT